MALLTDSVFMTLADLTLIESEIPDVAETENIDLPSFIAMQVDEFIGWLNTQTASATGYLPPYNQPYAPTLALASMLTQSSNRTRVSLNQIQTVNSEYPGMWSDFKRVAVYEAVANFYRQASRRRDNDRYEEKRDDYRDEIKNKYRPRFLMRGVPVVYIPLDCPGAFYIPTSGVWSAATNLSVLSGIPGSGLDPQFDVAISWTDQGYVSPLKPAQGESAPSARATIQVSAGDKIVVNIAGLTAPNGLFRPSMLANIPVTPRTTAGWNIYAGVTGGPLWLQNGAPLPYGTKASTLTAALATNTALAGNGQNVDIYLTIQKPLFRG